MNMQPAFPSRLRAARECAGLSQTQAAARAGFAPGLWSAYERGVRVPSLEQVIRLAVALECDPWNLDSRLASSAKEPPR
jgi:transcriptional regulator with XRE-family HTH domain